MTTSIYEPARGEGEGEGEGVEAGIEEEKEDRDPCSHNNNLTSSSSGSGRSSESDDALSAYRYNQRDTVSNAREDIDSLALSLIGQVDTS